MHSRTAELISLVTVEILVFQFVRFLIHWQSTNHLTSTIMAVRQHASPEEWQKEWKVELLLDMAPGQAICARLLLLL